MKIWVDITNAPHVNFFEQLLQDWEAVGHEVEVTARPLSNTIPLLERRGIAHSKVGDHYGRSSIRKLLGFPYRCLQLWRFLRHKSVDVAISQSSFYSPVVAKLLGCRSIYTNDNEYAKGNLTGFLFADIVLLPEPLRAWASKRFFRDRVRFYPGIKECIYTHKLAEQVNQQRTDSPGLQRSIVFRPEPWTAQYHSADKSAYKTLIENLAEDFDILVLPRGEEQGRFFEQIEKKGVRIQRDPLSIPEIAKVCGIFVGAGGSMSREFAYLGIPTISTYRGSLLAVDRYLIDVGVMYHSPDISSQAIRKAITQLSRKPVNGDLAKTGELAYRMVRDSINSL